VNFLVLAFQNYQKEGFGEQAFHGHTTLHPLALLGIVVLCGMILTVRRSKATYPFVLAACFLPEAQRVVIVGADFSMLRLLLLAGMLRVFTKDEVKDFRWRKLDTLVTTWSLVGMAAYVALWADFGKLIFRVGQLYDILGMYLFFRIVVRNWADVEAFARFSVKVLPLLVVLFYLEKRTGQNPFHFLGAQQWAVIREGRVRCQGPYPHAILAGCYFASLLPMVGARYFRKGGRIEVMVGTGMVLALVYLCASSTPVVGVMAAGIGVVGWKLRRSMRLVRWSTVGILVALHMAMKAPVWHLISRISFSQGSTSYHRFLLIDNSIRYFSDWALLGVKDTGYWGHAQGDLTNQFVREGARGGFLTLILFVWVLAEAFSLAGRLWRRVERNRAKRAVAWGLGVAVFVNGMMFLSISITHSQQNMMIFLFPIAALGSLAPPDRGSRRRKRRSAVRTSTSSQALAHPASVPAA